jgi:uncharacterized cupredoxin-like copper-binding protein
MARMRLIPAVLAMVLVVAVAGCSSSSKTSTSSGGGGVSVTSAATSGTVVHVDVSDTSGLSGPMTMTATPSTVPAGNVTFIVKNTGTIDHEAVVLQLTAGQTWDKLPVDNGGDPPAPVTTGADKVSETGNIGETGDPNLKPGTSRTFVIKNMKSGNYAIVCNIAQHYGMGMRAQFTVS